MKELIGAIIKGADEATAVPNVAYFIHFKDVYPCWIIF